MGTEYHARLSPSSAHRWVHCPPSVRMSDGIPPTTSKYAEAGTTAHAIAELKARKYFTVMNKRTFTAQLKRLQTSPHYAPEMEEYTDKYLEVLQQHAFSFKSLPFTALESAVPVGAFTGETKADGGPATGTADCIQIGEGVLWVTDYKNGAGVPVDADNNPQMMLYALGALALYAPIYGDTIHTVRMTIVQPAIQSVSDFEISKGDLKTWGESVLTPAAKMAMAGEGEVTPSPDPNGWCKFCPCKNTCRARRDEVLAVEAFGQKLPPLLSEEEVADALTRGAPLIGWYNDLKEFAEGFLLGGGEIPGYFLAEGRTSRKWCDPDQAASALPKRGVAEEIIWERKLLTPAALQKELGKKVYDDSVKDLVAVSPGKPTLAKEGEKKKEYSPATAAFEKVTQDDA